MVSVYKSKTVSNGLSVYLGYVYVQIDSEKNFQVAKLVSNG